MPLIVKDQGQYQLLHFSAFQWAHLPGTLCHCDVADLSQEKIVLRITIKEYIIPNKQLFE